MRWDVGPSISKTNIGYRGFQVIMSKTGFALTQRAGRWTLLATRLILCRWYNDEERWPCICKFPCCNLEAPEFLQALMYYLCRHQSIAPKAYHPLEVSSMSRSMLPFWMCMHPVHLNFYLIVNLMPLVLTMQSGSSHNLISPHLLHVLIWYVFLYQANCEPHWDTEVRYLRRTSPSINNISFFRLADFVNGSLSRPQNYYFGSRNP